MNYKTWSELKAGDLIISKTGIIREVATGNSYGYIGMHKLITRNNKSKFTRYSQADRKKFELYAKKESYNTLIRPLRKLNAKL